MQVIPPKCIDKRTIVQVPCVFVWRAVMHAVARRSKSAPCGAREFIATLAIAQQLANCPRCQIYSYGKPVRRATHGVMDDYSYY